VFNLDSGLTTVVGSNDGARPRADGAEFITLNQSVRFAADPDCNGNLDHRDRVTIFNTASGLSVGGFELTESIIGVPVLSPDGMTIAGRWRNDSICFDDDASLTIWDREGVELLRGVPEIGDFDWLPDGRLVFEVGGNIALETERNTLRCRAWQRARCSESVGCFTGW
jgi:hypothetical protein